MIKFNEFPDNIRIIKVTELYEAYEDGRYMFISSNTLDKVLNKVHIVLWDSKLIDNRRDGND